MNAEKRTTDLLKLYDALLRRLLAAVDGEAPVKASLLDVARRFLSANSITANARPDLRRGLRAVAESRGLPFGKPEPTQH